MNGLSSLLLNESGCIGVNLYRDVDNRDIVYLLEKWLTQEDLDTYRRSPAYAILLGLETLLVSSPEIDDVYCCAEHTTLNADEITQ